MTLPTLAPRCRADARAVHDDAPRLDGAGPARPVGARAARLATWRMRGSVAGLALVALMAACGGGGGGGSSDDDTSGGGSEPPAEPAGEPRLTTVADGLDHPWGLAFLPDGRFLVTERGGAMLVVKADGTRQSVAGLPALHVEGQGGLLDVALEPGFADHGRIVWSYAEAGSGVEAGRYGLAVARGTLDADTARVSNVQVLLRQEPKVASTNHYGGRIAFGADGRLFIAMGDHQLTSERGYAQDLSRDHGKIARIAADGRIPADNPFVATAGADPAIWSYGHRNPQGLAFAPDGQTLWSVEHGPQGGDELNRIEPGANFGWPRVSHGCEYGSPVGTCPPVGGASSGAGYTAPATVWVPTSTAPSGMAFVTGDAMGDWSGTLLVGALAGRTLWQIDLAGSGNIVCTPMQGQTANRCAQVPLLAAEGKRIRDVRQGPDGWIYLLTDEGGGEDALLRIER